MSLATLVTRLKDTLFRITGARSPVMQRVTISQLPETMLLTHLAALEAGRQPEGWTNYPYSREELARLIRTRAIGRTFHR